MRTLFLFSNASHYGGAERSIEALVPALAETYNLVVFAENAHHLQALARLAGPRISVLPLPAGNGAGAWLQSIFIVRDAFAEQRPDLLICNTNKGALLCATVQRLQAKPTPAFVFVRDFMWRHKRLIFSLLRNYEVITPTQAVVYHAQWRKLLKSTRVHVVSNAVRAAGPDAPPATEQAVVLCPANIARWKGLTQLVAAFSLAVEANPQLRLVIAGAVHESDYHAELVACINTHKLADKVQLLPYVEDIARLYAQAAMVVSSSLSKHGGPETFGRVVIEAWLHARPVIAFAAGGPRYLIREGIDGYLVEEGNLEALAQRIGLLAAQPRLARKLGMQGRARALEEFSDHTIAAELSMRIERFLEGTAPARPLQALLEKPL